MFYYLEYLKSAVRFLQEGIIDCLVTAPVNKRAIHLNRPSFVGHTEFLA
ncbi:MAG: 4-hydroxythreonine-4-phosphate dehydrogenase PdxA, partial [Candidatus Omnitrophica bacterium]|nr:4-hydroxythreonine-4-phosphate dehydrogenase PdxA [Candidatus Omnitrophota bacterium]